MSTVPLPARLGCAAWLCGLPVRLGCAACLCDLAVRPAVTVVEVDSLLWVAKAALSMALSMGNQHGDEHLALGGSIYALYAA